VLNNTAPTQVYLYQGANVSLDGQWSDSMYANDNWQLGRRVTLNIGIRSIISAPIFLRNRDRAASPSLPLTTR
jgi:hypothetical protein